MAALIGNVMDVEIVPQYEAAPSTGDAVCIRMRPTIMPVKP